jgi:hypothetical protein
MLDFGLQVLGAKPEDTTLLVTEDLFYKIVKQVSVKGEKKKKGHRYHLQYYSDAKLKEWMEKPKGNVPENFLPTIKALFLCYSQYNQDEFLGLLSDRIVQGIKRRDPSLKDFTEAMNEFVQECKSNPTKDFLLFLVFASHGYHVAGFQEVLSPFLDK